MRPTISVIIPTINEEANIGLAIQSAQAAGANEVIVADGGSHDATLKIASAERARITTGVTGRARQQNSGAALATCDFLLFQHADCRLSVECLRQIEARTQQHPALVHGGFRQSIEASGRLFRWLESGNAWRCRWAGLTYGDQGIFVRRDVFLQVGGFPEVAIMEDVMLLKRLKRWGRPQLLDGPLLIDPRRWQHQGIVRQTLQNWLMLSAFYCGVSPKRLGRYYARHDQ